MSTESLLTKTCVSFKIRIEIAQNLGCVGALPILAFGCKRQFEVWELCNFIEVSNWGNGSVFVHRVWELYSFVDGPKAITQLIAHIAQAIDDPERKQLKTTVVTDWLMKKGFMTKETLPDGKTKRLPTSAGMQLGIMTQLQQGQHGTYEAVYYTPGAQQFVLDHLPEMLEKE